MIYWAPFLHFYQPPIQFHSILKKVCNESYRPLVKMFLEHSMAKITINICGILTEMLHEHGLDDVLDGVRQLADNGQIEFVDSAKYHPIIPLIPASEARRQIRLNHRTNRHFFGGAYKPRGVFPPEMCYSNDMIRVLSSMGYDWFLISGIACSGKWPMDFVPMISRGEASITVFFRDDILSNKVSFKNLDSAGFISELINLSRNKKDIYVITAMDAETFGHHIQNWEKLFLAEVYKNIHNNYVSSEERKERLMDAGKGDEAALGRQQEIKVVTISEILDKFPAEKVKPPRPSSWSTTKEDMNAKKYYPLWKDENNRLHGLQWEHLEICFLMVKEASRVIGGNGESKKFFVIARALLDKAAHSCQFWWANKERGMWDINLINKGLILQEETVLNAYKAICLSMPAKEAKQNFYYKVVAARDIANKVRDLLFNQ